MKSPQCPEGSDNHPKDHSILIFTDASNMFLDTRLYHDSAKGLVVELNMSTHKHMSDIWNYYLGFWLHSA